MDLRIFPIVVYHQSIHSAKVLLNAICNRLTKVLQEEQLNYYIPPMAQKDEQEFVAEFSYKYAAVNAGLGWNGKNDVLITETYGPRIRLLAILIDHEFTYGTKIVRSRCPEKCRLCVDICPHKTLSGASWNIEAKRKDIIDYHLCNERRSEFLKNHDRKSSCGLCMVVCPFGQPK